MYTVAAAEWIYSYYGMSLHNFISAEQPYILSNPAGILVTKRQDALPQYLVKSRSREIVCLNKLIAMKFDWRFDSPAVEALVEFQSERTTLNLYLAILRDLAA